MLHCKFACFVYGLGLLQEFKSLNDVLVFFTVGNWSLKTLCVHRIEFLAFAIYLQG